MSRVHETDVARHYAGDPGVAPRLVLVSPERGANMRENLAGDLISPVEVIFTAP